MTNHKPQQLFQLRTHRWGRLVVLDVATSLAVARKRLEELRHRYPNVFITYPQSAQDAAANQVVTEHTRRPYETEKQHLTRLFACQDAQRDKR